MTNPNQCAEAQMREEFLKWVATLEGHPFAGRYLDLMWLAWQAAIQSREPRGIPMGEFRRIFAPPETDEGRAAARALTEALEFGGVLKTDDEDDEQAALSTHNPEKVEGDADEDAYVIERLGHLLAEIAVIVNGPEPALTRWSYHDLPEKVRALSADAAKYRELNTPEIHDFLLAVEREALHQRDRWGVEHDAGKADSDWFWLIGYLAGKAIHKPEKSLHHIITTAAACLNWHAAKIGAHNAMRPGISGEAAVTRPKPNDDPALSAVQAKENTND